VGGPPHFICASGHQGHQCHGPGRPGPPRGALGGRHVSQASVRGRRRGSRLLLQDSGRAAEGEGEDRIQHPVHGLLSGND